MFIFKPNELRRQKDAYNAKFQRRLDLFNNSLVEGRFREGSLVKSIVVWTIYKERIGNSTVGK